jgi:hypothetical protein
MARPLTEREQKTGWLCWQYAANWSPREFPLSGKNAGKAIDFRPLWRKRT